MKIFAWRQSHMHKNLRLYKFVFNQNEHSNWQSLRFVKIYLIWLPVMYIHMNSNSTVKVIHLKLFDKNKYCCLHHFIIKTTICIVWNIPVFLDFDGGDWSSSFSSDECFFDDAYSSSLLTVSARSFFISCNKIIMKKSYFIHWGRHFERVQIYMFWLVIYTYIPFQTNLNRK